MSGGAAGGGQNYTGVMLCNRPTEPTSYAPANLNPAVDAPSFRPVGLPAEPLGLNPAKENLVSNVLAVRDDAARRRAGAGRPAGTITPRGACGTPRKGGGEGRGRGGG